MFYLMIKTADTYIVSNEEHLPELSLSLLYIAEKQDFFFPPFFL